MRPIGQLESEEQARVFADYLYIREIAAEVESAGDKGWTIWVVDEDQVDEGRALLSRFRPTQANRPCVSHGTPQARRGGALSHD